MSGFPIKKALENFDFSFQPSIDKRQIEELVTMRFLESGENIVFFGPPGVGKTHLALALGLVAARHPFSIYYINCHTLIEQLKKSHYLTGKKLQNQIGVDKKDLSQNGERGSNQLHDAISCCFSKVVP
jgi:DNA replication protein DnaC